MFGEQQFLFINGEDAKPSEDRSFLVFAPLSGKTLYHSYAASEQDYNRAIEGAQRAFETWSTTSPAVRRAVLMKAAEIIEAYAAKGAVELMCEEISAPVSWAKTNIHGAAGMLREAASLATMIRGEAVPTERSGVTAFIERCPVGVVFAISPWNAPMILTARAVATPLICGNAVVLKPSEQSPKSQGLVIRALAEAGLPPGTLQFLPTHPEDAPFLSDLAIKHPNVRRINFTGSDRVGRIIAGVAATQLKQCVLELGGKAPAIVLDDANIGASVDAVIEGALAFDGQICMSTERVLVHHSIYEEFKTLLLNRLEILQKQSENGHYTTGLITPSSAQRVLSLMTNAIQQGCLWSGGDLGSYGPNSTILKPHVLSNVSPEMDIYHQETFGPVILLFAFNTDEEAVAVANDSDFSLTSSVFSQNAVRALSISKRLRVGTCHINSPTTYMESSLPQGGNGGGSGYGRFGGMAGVDEYTDKRIVTLAEAS